MTAQDPLEPLALAALRPEFALILAAARNFLGQTDPETLAEPLRQPLDWALVQRAADWHRLSGVLLKTLRDRPEPPPAFKTQLEAAYRHNAARNLQLTALLLRLTSTLEQADIEVIVIKGLALAGPLYRDQALRRSSDLDLLIDPRDVPRAMALLCADPGCQTAPLSPYALGVLMATDSELKLEIQGLLLELQWRMAPLDRFYPATWRELRDGAQTIALAGRQLPTLGPLELLPYLCFHGTKHLWYRLFWLLDVAAWLAHNPDWDPAPILARARQRRNERALLLGLALCRKLFASPMPTSLTEPLAAPAVTARVERLCARLLPTIDQAFTPEVSDWTWWRNIYWMYPEWPQRAALTWRYLFQPTLKDLQAFPLPPTLGALYYGLRPLRLAASALRMLSRKSTPSR